MIKYILCCILFPITLFSQQFDTAKLSDYFSQGKAYFRQAKEIEKENPKQAKELYKKSLLRFISIEKKGKIANGKLYYNIGNIYLLLGDIGRSILYYRRAQLFIPYDQNVILNLRYAREKCVDKIPAPSQKQALKILFFWHYDIPSKQRLYLFILFFSLIWVFLAIRLYYKRLYIHWLIALSIFISLALLCSLFVNILTEMHEKSGVIIAKKVVARKGNGESYSKSFKKPLHAGVEFLLIENRGEWMYIQLNDGRRCWIKKWIKNGKLKKISRICCKWRDIGEIPIPPSMKLSLFLLLNLQVNRAT